MSETVKRLIPRARWLAIVGALAFGGLAFRSAHSEGEAGRPSGVAQTSVVARTTVDPLVTNSVGRDFVSPQELSKQFCDRLAEIMRERPLPSPWELVDQLKGERLARCPASGYGKEVGFGTIYASARKSVVVIGGISPRRRRRNGQFLCSQFVIEPRNRVTNAHVMEAFANTKAIAVMTDDGRVFPWCRYWRIAETTWRWSKVDAENLYPLPIARDNAWGQRCASRICPGHARLKTPSTRSQGIVSASFACR